MRLSKSDLRWLFRLLGPGIVFAIYMGLALYASTMGRNWEIFSSYKFNLVRLALLKVGVLLLWGIVVHYMRWGRPRRNYTFTMSMGLGIWAFMPLSIDWLNDWWEMVMVKGFFYAS